MRTVSIALVAVLLGGTDDFIKAQQPIQNVNDGQALQRECETAIDVADNGPSSNDASDGETDELERGSDMGQCLGLVSGVWHTHMVMVDELGSPEAFCPTESISSGKMARLVDDYLAKHPDDLQLWDTVVILRAFVDAFPCS